jgi:hypothetical protein
LIENRTCLKASAHPKDSIYQLKEQKIWADVEADFFKKGENVQLYNGQLGLGSGHRILLIINKIGWPDPIQLVL